MGGFLLDLDYQTVDEHPVIRLFLQDGVVEDTTFEPYIYISSNEPQRVTQEVLDLEADGDKRVVRVEEVEKGYFGEKRPFLKVTFKHPGDVPRLRDKIRQMDGVSEVYEDAILFTRRYLMDKGLSPMGWVEVEGESVRPAPGDMPDINIMAIDIEVYNPKAKPREDIDPVIMVSAASSSGTRKVISWKAPPSGAEFVEVLKDEKAVLERLASLVKEEDPDIIVGYNSDNFDFPYLNARAKVLGMELGLGRDGSPAKTGKGRTMASARIVGRPHVDIYPIIRRSVKLTSYVLEDVVAEVLGREKEKVPKDAMWRIWDKEGPDLDGFFDYSLEDAEVTLILAEKFITLYYELSRLVGQTIHDTTRMTAGQLVEWLLIREAVMRDEVVPNRARGEEMRVRAGDTYTGGYVREPRKGLVEDIAVFDFRSLYPSVIVTHNIDPSTFRRGTGENQVPDLDYYFTSERQGFIPRILQDLVDRRSQMKRQMKEASDEAERKVLDVSQYALKILANSFYGYMGYPRARWYKKECAESVTAFARYYIQKVMTMAEEEFGMEVVYGDTDSLFVIVPAGEKEKAMAFMDQANESLPGMLELEYEGFYPRGVFVTKKRYALIGEDDKITVKGLEFVRRDWSPIARNTQEAVLMALLKDASPEKAAQIVRDAVEDIKEGRVTLDDLIIYTQLTRRIDKYKNIGPHVVAAQKLIDSGKEVTPGTLIGYVIERGHTKTISQRAAPVDLAQIENIDPDYYIDNQLLPAVLRIIEAIGYSKDYLKTGHTQEGLDKWF